MKVVRSRGYNYNFDPRNGMFMRWGETYDDDPTISPFGSEIADIEISTICHGITESKGIRVPCRFCYKSNRPKGEHMPLEAFKEVFHTLQSGKNNAGLTQIAFGIGDLDPENGGNPDMFHIFDYTRENGVIPNVTINGDGLTEELAKRYANTCGAVAVSRYSPKDICYDAVELLVNSGLVQTNIHQLVAEETYEDILELYDDMENDKRLKGLRAIVLLSLKQKGRGTHFNRISDDKFQHLVDTALERGLSIGFDSCTANKFLNAVKDYENYENFEEMAEPCESGLFSSYVNVHGVFSPCSFVNDRIEANLIQVEDFMEEVWFSESMEEWREDLNSSCRSCPVYEV